MSECARCFLGSLLPLLSVSFRWPGELCVLRSFSLRWSTPGGHTVFRPSPTPRVAARSHAEEESPPATLCDSTGAKGCNSVCDSARRLTCLTTYGGWLRTWENALRGSWPAYRHFVYMTMLEPGVAGPGGALRPKTAPSAGASTRNSRCNSRHASAERAQLRYLSALHAVLLATLAAVIPGVLRGAGAVCGSGRRRGVV